MSTARPSYIVSRSSLGLSSKTCSQDVGFVSKWPTATRGYRCRAGVLEWLQRSCVSEEWI
jgi:hypothetical protein